MGTSLGQGKTFTTSLGQEEAGNQRGIVADEANANFLRFVRSMYRVQPSHSTYILRSLRSAPTLFQSQQDFRDRFALRALRSNRRQGSSPDSQGRSGVWIGSDLVGRQLD